ncbi:MAG: hypothetical protein HW394_1712 [Acidobacteria bacterium]|nr:hypothetical protein [Acidobacteriota bacterium]
MKSMWLTRGGAAAVLVAAILSSGCGDFVRGSRSPSQLVIVGLGTPARVDRELQGGTGVPGSIVPVAGYTPGPLYSDVPSNSEPAFQDVGEANLGVILKDPGASGALATPSSLNAVTITRYTVTYKRSGGPTGQNIPGVDVPHPIDGALTLTIPAGGTGKGFFELVRHTAKREAPLAAVGNGTIVLTMIADVTFYGRDQAGNAVSATGNVQIIFGNFSQ